VSEIPIPNDVHRVPADAERINLFTAADVASILKEKNWLAGEANEIQAAWCARAATFLGPQVADRAALADLLGLIFEYDAQALLQATESHAVMSRYAARDALRQLALLLLDGAPLTSERFSDILMHLKQALDIRGRELFHPLRLALAGRAGGGELDRVILLLDEAAAAGFAVPPKTARERILEFCSALD
jgi:nondiscriminating glutamyl-tRNA synthetase